MDLTSERNMQPTDSLDPSIDNTQADLEEYLNDIYPQLDTQNSRFVNGDGIYVGTTKLREFYKGKQWQWKKEGGGKMRVFNYCFSIVENMTAFLANETPEMNATPSDVSDPIERARSEAITSLLGDIHGSFGNQLPIQYQRGARIGSLTGMTFIYGPIWDEYEKMPKYWNIENPEDVRIIWKDANQCEMEGFVIDQYVTFATLKKRFGKYAKEKGIDLKTMQSTRVPDSSRGVVSSGDGPSWKRTRSMVGDVPMYEVREYLDDTYYIAQLVNGTQKTTLRFFRHDYGFVPGLVIPNIHNPGEGYGTSDIENVLDAQVAYNESKSNEEDIIAQVAFSALWGKNLDNYSVINTGLGAVYNFNDEAELNAMPRSANPILMNQYEKDIQGDLINLSGQNQALYPGGARQVLASTGRALSVMMTGVNNKIALRKNFWINALVMLNRNCLILVEKYVDGAKDLINGNYKTEVFISSVLLRDVTEEINKFNAKLQSLTTTQKNLGIPSPSEEQKLIKEELKDPIFGVEISRQPALLQQVIQMELQAMMQSGQGAGGTGAEENPEQAMLGVGEGEPPGSQPTAVPQQRGASIQTPEGAVRAAGQRKTGVPQARSKK